MLAKGKIHQEELSILNIYAPNERQPSFVKETLLKLKAHSTPNRVIVGEFNTPLLSMDRTGKQKLKRETMKLIETLDQLDLADIYRTFHPKAKEHTFISALHCTFSKINHIIHPGVVEQRKSSNSGLKSIK